MTIQQNFPNLKPTLNLDFANVKALDPRITFSRASEGRFYGTQTAKAEENLLIRSQDFTTTWSSGNSTKTANTSTAPDGTETADTIAEDDRSTFRRIDQTVSASGIVTISVFAKLGAGSRYLVIGVSNGVTDTASATFDLSLGTNTQTQANGAYSSSSATITAVAESFYRCTLTVTTTTVTRASVGFTDTSTPSTSNRGFGADYTGDNTSTIILWGAQLEQRSSVTSYTPTTTQQITNYIPVLQTAASGVARFDHDPVTGESLGLLIEEQRTNLLTYSEQFDNAAWTKSNSSITANTIVAPDGSATADKLVENTSNSTHGCNQSIAITLGSVYTLSTYAKAGERTILRLASGSSLGTKVAFVDLSNGTITSESGTGTASVSSVGDGWYRIALTVTAVSSVSDGLFYRIVESSTNFSYTGDGTSGIYIWGAQLEAGAFPTSYIPTVASQVTRAADAASMTGTNFSSWYRADEGTLYADTVVNLVATNRVGFNISDGTASNFIDIRPVGTATTQVRYAVRSGDATQADFNSTGAFGGVQNRKSAGSYQVNNFVMYANGQLTGSVVSGIVPTAVDRAIFGAGTYPNSTLNGHIRKIAYYPARITNAQLQGLTS